MCGNQFVARRHVDAIDVGKAHRRRGRSEIHLAGTGIARHLHDLATGGAAHDRVINQQHVLAVEFLRDRVELLPHRFPPRGLARHDEGAADVAVLHETFAIRQPEPARQFHRRRTARIRNRHHGVDVHPRRHPADALGQVLAHLDPRLVDRDAVDQRIRPRQVNELEHARRLKAALGALARHEVAVDVDQHRLARRHVAQDLETERIDRDTFGGNQILGPGGRLVAADDQRANPERVAKGQQSVAGDHRNHRVGTPHAAMHAGNRAEDRIVVEAETRCGGLQLVRQHVEQHFGIGIGVDVPQILQVHLALEFVGVGQVAVVRQHDAERRIDVERLRLVGVVGRTGGRIATVADSPVADQVAHVARAEHVAHQARPLVHVELRAVCGGDAGGVLPAMLEHLQAIVEQLVNGRSRDDADNSAHASPSPILDSLRHRGRHPGLRCHYRRFQGRRHDGLLPPACPRQGCHPRHQNPQQHDHQPPPETETRTQQSIRYTQASGLEQFAQQESQQRDKQDYRDHDQRESRQSLVTSHP